MPALTLAVIAERTICLEELGFSETEAMLLASSRDSAGQLATIHDIRKALGRGATHAQALAIFA